MADRRRGRAADVRAHLRSHASPGHLRAAPLAAHSHNLATQSDAPVHPNGGEVLARLDRSDELERMNDGGVPYIDLVGGHTGSFIPADGWTQVIFAR